MSLFNKYQLKAEQSAEERREREREREREKTTRGHFKFYW